MSKQGSSEVASTAAPISTAMTEEEHELVSRAAGKELADAWVTNPRQLSVPDTLLNSQDIVKVVEATGLISPFFKGGGRKSRLKKAAYEGRIGQCAFMFEDKNLPVQVFDADKDTKLLVPKNSIVFVECDLDFRIPDFIALRFNLQIQHVHRGLLLGTGPLVDPGFWGKLCIPLHNLTDQDYEIPAAEGLIWIEFTKTTLPSDQHDGARVALEGTPRDENGHWNIRKFLDKAATQYTGEKVPIRSSLPRMFEEANAAVAESAEAAKKAVKEAETLRTFNVVAVIAAASGLCALAVTAAGFLNSLSARNEDIAVRLQASTGANQRSLEEHIQGVVTYGTQPAEVRAQLPILRAEVARQRAELVQLRQQIDRLNRKVEADSVMRMNVPIVP